VTKAGENVDPALACFSSMISKESSERVLQEIKAKKNVKWKQLRKRGSRLCLIPRKTDQISMEQDDYALPDKKGG
jgi:hypothetical protein